MNTAIVVLGGELRDQLVPPGLSGTVIAADSGLQAAERMDLQVSYVVGDLDSASPDAVRRASAAGAEVRQTPSDKDLTDFELAMRTASELEADEVVVLGGGGGRLDHLIANLNVLAAPHPSADAVWGVFGRARIDVVRRALTVSGTPGALLSLAAHGGPASGVSVSGVRWPLSDATLAPDVALGTSNELTEPPAQISVSSGVVLVTRPDMSNHYPPLEGT